MTPPPFFLLATKEPFVREVSKYAAVGLLIIEFYFFYANPDLL